jgi:uncharacterized membrane protein
VESRARAMGHSIHPSLVVFPLGLLTTAVIFDILYLITDRTGFQVAAAYTIAAGILGGLAAGLFGFIDLTGIPAGTRAKRVGAVHGVGNVLVLGLFAASWLLRRAAADWHPTVPALVCSFAGLAVSFGTAWLGGELVERMGVGVREGANVNAPSSVTRKSTSGRSRLASR